MNAATTSRFHSSISAASRQRSARRRSMSSSRSSMRLGCLLMRSQCRKSVGRHSGIEAATLRRVGEIRFGPARVPSQESPEAAIAVLQERGYTRVRDRLRGSLLDGLRLRGALRRARARRGHRPLGARADRRLHGPRRARQEAQHGGRHARPLRRHREGRAARRSSSSTPASCSAARARRRSTRSCEQLGELRARLEKKDRAVPFGIEVMGRVRELGSADDVVEISRRCGWVRPGARLRAHARDLGRRVHVRRAVRRGAREGRRRARAGRAVPHPLLGHPVREPQRDEAPAATARARCAPSRCATRSRSSSGRRR